MSTRSFVYIDRGGPDRWAARNFGTAQAGVYRHSDGYLTEGGRDLLAFTESRQARSCHGNISSIRTVLEAIFRLRGTIDPVHKGPASVRDNAGHGDTEYEYWLDVPERGEITVYWRQRRYDKWGSWLELDWATIERADEAEAKRYEERGYEAPERTRSARNLIYK